MATARIAPKPRAVRYNKCSTERPIGWVILHLIGVGVLTAAQGAAFHLTRRA